MNKNRTYSCHQEGRSYGVVRSVGSAAEANCRKFRVWNNHGYVTTLPTIPWLFQTRKFRRFSFRCVW